MGFNDGCSLGFLHTPLTTLRSKPVIFLYNCSHSFCRVLLCCIKYLGNLPCPCCLVHKSEVRELGTKRDFKRRVTKMRVDDHRRRMLVETAREMVYVNGIRPGAKAISELLASRSLTPTRVSGLIFSNPSSSWLVYHLECLFGASRKIRTQFSFIICCWSHAWVWTWCMEGNIYPSSADSICPRRR